jgi:rhodanese-related sulfurtransferase
MANQVITFSSETENAEQMGVKDIAPEEFAKHLGEIFIVDVRRDDEFNGDLGHVAGAKHIVLDSIPERLSEIPKDGTVVFVCKSGGRSGSAAAFALGEGYKNVFNLKGGMLLWNKLGLKVERS